MRKRFIDANYQHKSLIVKEFLLTIKIILYYFAYYLVVIDLRNESTIKIDKNILGLFLPSKNIAFSIHLQYHIIKIFGINDFCY